MNGTSKFQNDKRLSISKRHGLSGVGHDIYFNSVEKLSAAAHIARGSVLDEQFHQLFLACPLCEGAVLSVSDHDSFQRIAIDIKRINVKFLGNNFGCVLSKLSNS